MTHLSPSLHRITRFKPLPAGWWCQTRGAALEAIPAVPAVAVILSAGVATHHAPAALIAAGGAMSIGFGAYKKVEGSPLPATVLATIGCALAAVAGSLLGHSLATLTIATLVAATLSSFFASVNEGPRWIAMETTIALLIAGTFPATPLGALARGGFILSGGALQLVTISGIQRLLGTAPHPLWPLLPGRPYFHDIATKTRHELDRNLVHALVSGAAVAASLLLSRALGLPKSYWAPMTTLIVLKADYRSIGYRGTWRLVGTLVGGLLAGLLVFAHLDTPASLTLTIVLLYLTYVLHNAHYGLFVGVMTAWLVVMLGLGQHVQASVAWQRAVFTVLGGVLAMAVELPRALSRWSTDASR